MAEDITQHEASPLIVESKISNMEENCNKEAGCMKNNTSGTPESPEGAAVEGDKKQRNLPAVDFDVYAAAVLRTISDATLPCPINLGILGKTGQGKSLLTKALLWKMKKACDSKCDDLNDPPEPRDVSWRTYMCCCKLPLIVYLLILGLLYFIVTAGISAYMVVVFLGIEVRLFSKKSGTNIQDSNLTTTQLPITTAIINKTAEGLVRKGSIITAIADNIAIPIIVTLALLLALLIIATCLATFSFLRNRHGKMISEVWRDVMILIVMALCDVPEHRHLQKLRKTEIIPICFNAWVFAGSDNLWSTMIRHIFNQIETMFGIWKYRFYRSCSHDLQHEHDFSRSTSSNNCNTDASVEGLDDTLLIHQMKAVDTVEDNVSLAETEIQYEQLQGQRTEVVVSPAKRFGIEYPVLIMFGSIAVSTSIITLSLMVAYVDAEEIGDIYRWIEGVAGGVIGLTLLSQLKNIFSIVSSLCVGASTRIGFSARIAANNNGILTEDLGFMNKVRSELELLFGFIRLMEQLYLKRFRILLLLEDLDKCSNQKIREVIEAMTVLLSDKGDPIVSIITIDSKTVIDALSINNDGFAKLDRLFTMKLCLPDVQTCHITSDLMNRIEKVTEASLARQAHLQNRHLKSRNLRMYQQNRVTKIRCLERGRSEEYIELKAYRHSDRSSLYVIHVTESEIGEFTGKYGHDILMRESDLREVHKLKSKMTRIAVKTLLNHSGMLMCTYREVSTIYNALQLSVSCYVTQLQSQDFFNCSHETQLEAMGKAGKLPVSMSLTCIQLARLIILCELWQYRMNWIIYSLEQEISSDRTISDHYNDVKKHLTHLAEWQQYIKLDATEEGFEKMLNEFGQITTSATRILLPFLVNLDRSMKDSIMLHMSSKALKELPSDT